VRQAGTLAGSRPAGRGGATTRPRLVVHDKVPELVILYMEVCGGLDAGGSTQQESIMTSAELGRPKTLDYAP